MTIDTSKATWRSLPPVRWYLRRKRARAADVYLLSFPKAGRGCA